MLRTESSTTSHRSMTPRSTVLYVPGLSGAKRRIAVSPSGADAVSGPMTHTLYPSGSRAPATGASDSVLTWMPGGGGVLAAPETDGAERSPYLVTENTR